MTEHEHTWIRDQCITFNVSTAGVEDTDLAEQTERLLHALQTVTVVRLRQAGGKQREGARCSAPCVGPVQVTTVDKYQGQQNEYVLLSLVRTRAVGHVRDVRRLVVAMSRARLGLYIFGRLPLFANCYELQPTMAQLVQRPTQLALHPAEYWQVGSLHRAVLCRSGSDAGTQALCISMSRLLRLLIYAAAGNASCRVLADLCSLYRAVLSVRIQTQRVKFASFQLTTARCIGKLYAAKFSLHPCALI